MLYILAHVALFDKSLIEADARVDKEFSDSQLFLECHIRDLLTEL